MSMSRPLAKTASTVVSRSLMSCRFAGPVDQPIGIAVTVHRDRPFPALFAPVTRVGAGVLATVGGLGQAAVDSDLGQVETDDPIERDERFEAKSVEHVC